MPKNPGSPLASTTTRRPCAAAKRRGDAVHVAADDDLLGAGGREALELAAAAGDDVGPADDPPRGGREPLGGAGAGADDGELEHRRRAGGGRVSLAGGGRRRGAERRRAADHLAVVRDDGAVEARHGAVARAARGPLGSPPRGTLGHVVPHLVQSGVRQDLHGGLHRGQLEHLRRERGRRACGGRQRRHRLEPRVRDAAVRVPHSGRHLHQLAGVPHQHHALGTPASTQRSSRSPTKLEHCTICGLPGAEPLARGPLAEPARA